MALLVFSQNCKFSQETIKYIQTQPALQSIVRFHDILTQGVPSPKITRVPTLVTNEGQMHVGREVRAWLESMVPTEFMSWETTPGFCSNLDGSSCHANMFDIENYGESLQPELTPELEERISKSVTDSMSSMNRT